MPRPVALLVSLTLVCVFSLASPASAVVEWPTFRQNYNRTGYQPASGNASFENFSVIWSYETMGPVKSSPALADINDDGLLEVVVGSDDGKLYVFDYQGNLMWAYQTGGSIRSSPTIDDVDLDGIPEILIGSDDGKLYVLQKNGKLLWSFTADGPIVSSPVVRDLYDTNRSEVIFGTMGEKLYVLDYQGDVLFNYTIPGGIPSSPSVWDINGDGRQEIVFGSNNNIVYIFPYPPYLHWEYQTDSHIGPTPVIVDYDKNNRPDVVFISDSGNLVALKEESFRGDQPANRKCRVNYTTAECYRDRYSYSRYVPKWTYNNSGDISASLAFANLNEQKRPEIVITNLDGMLYILDTNSTRIRVGTYTAGAAIESSPAIADLNMDGSNDIVFGSNDWKVYVIDNQTRTRWMHVTGGRVRSSPAIADLNGNGALEIAVGSDDGKIYVFGDRVKWVKDMAEELYYRAEELYEVHNITDLDDYLNRSQDLYESVGYLEGLDKLNFLRKRIIGDNLIKLAKDQYNQTNYYNATELLQKAALVYRYVGDGRGIAKVYGLLHQIRADAMIEEAEYFLAAGDYLNATLLADKTHNYSKSINYTKGVNKSQTLMTWINRRMEADKLYVEALTIYSTKNKSLDNISANTSAPTKLGGGEPSDTNESSQGPPIDSENAEIYALLEGARTLYLEANSTRDMKLVDRLISRMTGDLYYKNAYVSYKRAEYEDARTASLKALGVYSEINDSEGANKSQHLYEKSELHINASKLMEDAKAYYTATDFMTAANTTQQALELYKRIPDPEGILAAEALLEESLSTTTKKDGSGMPPEVKIVAAIIGFIVLFRLRVVWYRAGKPGPAKIIKAIPQAPTKLEESSRKKKEKQELRERFTRPGWMTLSELKAREHGGEEHPVRWFRQKIKPAKDVKETKSKKKSKKEPKLKAEEKHLAEKLDAEVGG